MSFFVKGRRLTLPYGRVSESCRAPLRSDGVTHARSLHLEG
jgi:hypothetical protein